MYVTIGPSRPGRRRPAWRRFRHDARGATAVEFGLIALPFFALLWAIIETALAFWAQQMLETAVAAASRQLYTNQFTTSLANAKADAAAKKQPEPQPADFFKTLICSNVTALIDCTKLNVDVKSIHGTSGQFSDAASTFRIPVTNGNYDTSGYGYDPPGSNEICVVRASMEYPRFTSIASGSASLRDGNRLLLSTFTFRAEPF